MKRRSFLNASGLTLGLASMSMGFTTVKPSDKLKTNLSFNPMSWNSVRDQFDLDHSHIQMSQMLLASHPKPVAEEIERHRKAYDTNPATYWEDNWLHAEVNVAKAAAKYMGVDAAEVALTDSTTMATSMLFNGMKLKPGDEVLQTTHDHYVTDMAIEYACKKKGVKWRKVEEYSDPKTVTVEEVTGNIAQAIRPETRVVMVTWVQSCTGVKLPIKEIGEVVAAANESRSESNRIYYCVDGVHGFGNQDLDIYDVDCDFFSAGTHKWIFGPRGTGLLFGRKSAWDFVEPTIPAFTMYPYEEWLGVEHSTEKTFHEMMTPGGFHAFDHRWSVHKAFEFHTEMGRDRVHQRTTELNTRLKQQVEEMDGVNLLTPLDPNLSAGINCFTVGDLSAGEVVKRMHEKHVIASASPYLVSYPRLTPCVINTEDEVDESLVALKKVSKGA